MIEHPQNRLHREETLAEGKLLRYTFVLGPLANNAFLWVAPQAKEALLIDAPAGIEALLFPYLEQHQARLQATLLTHGHFDHIGGLQALKPLEAPVYGHKGDLGLIQHPYSPYYPHIHTPPGYIDHFLEGGEDLCFLGERIHVTYTPGHSEGSLCYTFPHLECSFVGDLIFYKSVGRTDFPGSDFKTLEQSIQQHIYNLPDTYTLFPGHGKRTQVGVEKQHNPYVRP